MMTNIWSGSCGSVEYPIPSFETHVHDSPESDSSTQSHMHVNPLSQASIVVLMQQLTILKGDGEVHTSMVTPFNEPLTTPCEVNLLSWLSGELCILYARRVGARRLLEESHS